MGDVYNISQVGQGHQVVIQKGQDLKARLGNIQVPSGAEDLRSDVSSIIDDITSSDDLSANQKREILEKIEAAEEEMEGPPEQQNKSLIKQALETASTVASAAVPIAAAIAKIAA